MNKIKIPANFEVVGKIAEVKLKDEPMYCWLISVSPDVKLAKELQKKLHRLFATAFDGADKVFMKLDQPTPSVANMTGFKSKDDAIQDLMEGIRYLHHHSDGDVRIEKEEAVQVL